MPHRVLVADSSEVRTSVARAFHLAGADVCLAYGKERTGAPSVLNGAELETSRTGPLGHFLVVVFHQSRENLWRLAEKAGASADTSVWYTTEGTPTFVAQHREDLGPGIQSRRITPGQPLSVDEARTIIETSVAIAEGRAPNPLPDLYLPPPAGPEYLSALAILCQGYLAVAASSGQLRDDDEALVAMGWPEAKEDIKRIVRAGVQERWPEVQTSRWWLEALGFPVSPEGRGQLESKVEDEAASLKASVGDLKILLGELEPQNEAIGAKVVSGAYLHLAAVLGSQSCE